MAVHFPVLICCLVFLEVVTANPVPTATPSPGQTCLPESFLTDIRQIVNDASPGIQHLGDIPAYAATSCKQIFSLRPLAKSGRYWIQRSSGSVRVYCQTDGEQFNEIGPWMRIANVITTDKNSKCPAGLEVVTSPERLCRKRVNSGCSSAIFSTHEVPFKKICGKVIGIQYYSPQAFYTYYSHQTYTIDNGYVDGVIITYGRSPRQHVWTFAAAHDEVPGHNVHSCPCANNKSHVAYTGLIPEFIGDDYYCETGSRTSAQNRYYTEDPLWDGNGCGRFSTCCEGEIKPWFCKDLAEYVSSDIEVRVCADATRNNDEDVLLREIVLYIQ